MLMIYFPLYNKFKGSLLKVVKFVEKRQYYTPQESYKSKLLTPTINFLRSENKKRVANFATLQYYKQCNKLNWINFYYLKFHYAVWYFNFGFITNFLA